MKRKKFLVEIKNSPRDGPEGQSRKVNSAMCNAGQPHCATGFLSSANTEEGKYEEEKKRKFRKSLEGKGLIYRAQSAGRNAE